MWFSKKSRAGEYEITSASAPKFSVRLAKCDRAFADAALAQLKDDPSVPNDLTLERR